VKGQVLVSFEKRPVMKGLIACLVAGTVLSAQTPGLGTIAFPNSGAPAAQARFIRGVLLLHSFEYQDAAQAFREAQRLDPGFALAYWGEAMTYTHPLWNEQDRTAALAALQRLGPTPEARRERAPTRREQAYLHAVEVLYGEGSKAGRDSAYTAAMRRLAGSFPTDREAKVFYALSLLGLNQGVRDVPTYLRAAALLEKVFRDNPQHPGAAHLLIHAYDDAIHAPRGLAAARAYSKIAPDAAHAQHMTTHIFLALGMWDEVVSQNEIASGRDRSAWTPHHYTWWLGYGYLEQGRYGEALRHLERMRQNADWTTGHGLALLAQMRADYVINTERWDSPSLQWRIDLTQARSRARAADAFVAAFSALKRGDRAAANSARADLTALNRTPPAPETGYVDPVPAILDKELGAAFRQADGDLDGAVALMREAVSLEDAMPLEFGPPAVVKPSHELLGEILLQAGRSRAAQAEFARALRLAPRRALSLLGLARAAAAAGDGKMAARAYDELRRIWHRGEPNTPGLAEAARFLAARP
jgi:tetratricopeptide (TPR) repeat protein